jgi:hypothetical protein
MGVPVLPVLPGLFPGAVGDLTMTAIDKKIIAVNIAERRRRWARQVEARRAADPKHGDGGTGAKAEPKRDRKLCSSNF